MEQHSIGELEVSVAGLGCNNFGARIDERRTREVVAAALDAGVTLYDTADLYGGGASERLLGAALGGRRDEVVVLTKFGMRAPPAGLTGGDPRWVVRACEESLRRLGSDHIDVYLLHQPDPATSVAETLAAMNGLVEQGKVREIGCSNFSAAQLDEAATAAEERGLRRFAVVENEYSLLEREPDQGVLAACERLGMGFLPFFPLANGLLTGKYRRGRPAPAGTRLGGAGDRPTERVIEKPRLDVTERLAAFAESRGHTLLELAVSWLAQRPRVASVIAGATSPEQVRANVAATTAWRLDRDELAEIDRLTRAAGRRDAGD
jgi:aryl-alcohol dehydrogenase-like predicted oxidoreductase